MSSQALSHLAKARARLLLKSAFFGTLVVTTPTAITTAIPTAGTDMHKIYYNPDFVLGLDVDELIGLMAHEVLHIALMHPAVRNGRCPRTWNEACDYAINLMLINMGFKLPAGGLLDTAFKGMSAAQIYELLVQNQGEAKKQPQSGQGSPDGSDGSGGADASQDPGQGPSQSGSGSIKTMADGYQPLPGYGADLIEPTYDSPEEARAARDEVKGRIVQATSMGRMAGQMPGELLRQIEDLVHPAVNWTELLRPLMRAVVKNDESWSHRNRRFQNIYLPSRHSPAIGRIVVIGDTSGSITNDDLKLIGGSICDIAEEVQPEEIHMLWADTRVAGEQVFDRGDTIKLEPKGGGGTDMRVPLARAAELDPEIVVLISDGHTPWPDVAPDFPLVVVCTTAVPAPHGEVVRV